MQYTNIAQEKLNGKYINDKSLVRLNRSPYKVYLFQFKKNGAEILYNASVNKENAVVNSAKFPLMNLNLSPFGSLMRKDAHHTLFEADILYTYNIVNLALQKKSLSSTVKYLGVVKIDEKELFKLELINLDYKKYKYTVKEGEDLFMIGRDKLIGDYKILELNPSISYYDDVKAGDIITIPNYYSKSIYIYIDKETYLPYYIKVFDDEGLYETYKFKDLKLNVDFSDSEFTEDNSEYGF